MTKLGYILSAVALVAIGVIIGVYGAHLAGSGSFGGSMVYTDTHLVGDVYQGLSDTLIFRNGAYQNAPISTSTLFTSTGGITNSGALTQSGASTFSAAVTVRGAITATSSVSLTSTTTLTGKATFTCPVVYDGATTTTAYYMYASGTTLFATTTKPALCP